MKYSRFGLLIPVNCLWHSHKSKRYPKGSSQASSSERRSGTVA